MGAVTVEKIPECRRVDKDYTEIAQYSL